MIPQISNPTRQMFDVAASSAAPAKSKPLFHRVQLSSDRIESKKRPQPTELLSNRAWLMR